MNIAKIIILVLCGLGAIFFSLKIVEEYLYRLGVKRREKVLLTATNRMAMSQHALKTQSQIIKIQHLYIGDVIKVVRKDKSVEMYINALPTKEENRKWIPKEVQAFIMLINGNVEE